MSKIDLAFPPSYLQQCPACDGPLADHRFTDRQVTSEQLSDERYVDDMDHGWYDAFAKTFSPSTSDQGYVLRVLVCPTGSGAVVPLELAPNALADDRIAGMVVKLNENDLTHLSAALGSVFQVYSATWAARSST